MVIRTLDAKRDPFCPNENEKEILEPKVPYLSAIGALLYLAQCTGPDISFAINLFARYSNAPIRRHWNAAKEIFRYLKSTKNLGLFYTHKSSRVVAPLGSRIDSHLVGYTDVGYMSNPHRACSQMGYVFIVRDTAMS
ncbi:secreted RxLR effector protein 161-like [Pyrus communis]|uniref:secreted RxLR effector protein 161-like n=1 Tax=Pyrus communis TaxID=23211 RepID=UPI0035BFD89E